MSNSSHRNVVVAAGSALLRSKRIISALENTVMTILRDMSSRICLARPLRMLSLALAIIVTSIFFWLPDLQFAGMTSSANTAVQPKASPSPTAGEKVKLFYLREGTKIATVMNEIAKSEKSELHGLLIGAIAEDEIVLIGTDEKRRKARRLIATLDLPRPGVQMEMWGIQLSSRKPDDLADVMQRVRAEINKTQQAVRETYSKLEELSRYIELEKEFQEILVDRLHYKSALDPDRPLSISDILLRIVAAKDPPQAAQTIANDLSEWLRTKYPEYGSGATVEKGKPCKSKPKSKSTVKSGVARVPFERFFRDRGLIYNGATWEQSGDLAREKSKRGKAAVLNFALQYGWLIHEPKDFSPYYLQQSAGALNTRLQAATDALNLDIQDLFVAPTMDRIREIVREFCDVEYAQVGKTSIASLSGIPTVVTSYSVNAFDVTPPLRLSELLNKAKTLSEATTPFVPNAATQNTIGAMPLAQVIGLIGAFGEERSVWRELKSGVSMSITPNVLRNMTSAELQVDLKTGDPQAGTRETGVRPLSRVSQHDLNTKVYINAMDFFDLSAFGSQSTLNGGRGYVPIIGPVWRGIFGEAPGIGTLFSWKKPPQTVYSQSLVLTTSFITPTAMGVALLIPTDLPEGTRLNFKDLKDEVKSYEDGLFRRK